MVVDAMAELMEADLDTTRTGDDAAELIGATPTSTQLHSGLAMVDASRINARCERHSLPSEAGRRRLQDR